MHPTLLNEDYSLVRSFPIALITSRFNPQITQALQEGTIRQLIKRGLKKEDIKVFDVPGALEIPLLAKRLAIHKQFCSIIALGAVIRGDTSHYDLVCSGVNQGCMQVSLEYNIPVLFGVLTTENEQQAWDRLGGSCGHKGIETANAAVAMHQVLDQIHQQA